MSSLSSALPWHKKPVRSVAGRTSIAKLFAGEIHIESCPGHRAFFFFGLGPMGVLPGR